MFSDNKILNNHIDEHEKNHNEILSQLEEIKNLSEKINNLFKNNQTNSFLNPIIFNYNFKKEYAGGFIEYKRTLTSYANLKIDKLIRQIHWRIYEGFVTDGTKICYYIIGLEDSGLPSNISKEELEISLEIIKGALVNTSLVISYLCLNNSINNYNFLIVKFFLTDNDQCVEYF